MFVTSILSGAVNLRVECCLSTNSSCQHQKQGAKRLLQTFCIIFSPLPALFGSAPLPPQLSFTSSSFLHDSLTTCSGIKTYCIYPSHLLIYVPSTAGIISGSSEFQELKQRPNFN